jgi:hypothetical protein
MIAVEVKAKEEFEHGLQYIPFLFAGLMQFVIADVVGKNIPQAT